MYKIFTVCYKCLVDTFKDVYLSITLLLEMYTITKDKYVETEIHVKFAIWHFFAIL